MKSQTWNEWSVLIKITKRHTSQLARFVFFGRKLIYWRALNTFYLNININLIKIRELGFTPQSVMLIQEEAFKVAERPQTVSQPTHFVQLFRNRRQYQQVGHTE